MHNYDIFSLFKNSRVFISILMWFNGKVIFKDIERIIFILIKLKYKYFNTIVGTQIPKTDFEN